jgi:hypothetical protein
MLQGQNEFSLKCTTHSFSFGMFGQSISGNRRDRRHLAKNWALNAACGSEPAFSCLITGNNLIAYIMIYEFNWCIDAL